MSFRIILLLIFTTTLLIYGAMVFWTLPRIAEGAGGLAPFDMRPFGYSADEARTFLTALTPTARQIYLGPQQTLDIFYPALLATTLSLAFWRLRMGLSGLVGIALSIAGAVADYLENAAVKSMLLTQSPPDGDEIAWASSLTVIKSSATTLPFLLLLALGAVHFMRLRRKQ